MISEAEKFFIFTLYNIGTYSHYITALEEAVNAIMGIIYVFAKKVSDWGLLYRRYCKKSMKDSKMVDQTGMKVWSEGYFMNIFYPT